MSARQREPIAIVGASCRFPGGVDGLDGLWSVLAHRLDVVGPAPRDRGWADRPALTGGFLADAAGFDAAFFRLTEGEALAADPQQRVFLEICWQALEDARLPPSALAGQPVGVFAGAMPQGYGFPADLRRPEVAAYGATGGDTSAVAGRVSYCLDLAGPAVTVNTACSSALAALHLAVASLRRGESDLALAGGVTVLASPQVFDLFGQMGGTAADGRCKAFAAAADGAGWGEGAGVVVLERLSSARRRGSRVRAVIRGSAVNQDGASNGFSAPSGAAQRRVMRQALSDAGVGPEAVDLVEAHGTGTALGDPIEAEALIAVYGAARPPDNPVWVGSAKSNLTHTGAAAGLAGLLKVVAALEHETMPATLWADQPTQQVDWSAGVSLLAEERAWPAGTRPRLAAVSAFGASGTNAHVIVEEEPAAAAAPPPAGGEAGQGPHLWLLSAQGQEGLSAQAASLATWTSRRPTADLAAIGWSLATTRDLLPDRAALVADDRAGLLDGLAALAAGQRQAPAGAEWRLAAGSAVAGKAPPAGSPDPRLAFLFPAQGGQDRQAARGLHSRSDAFRAAFDEAAAAFAAHLAVPLADVLWGADDSKAKLLDQTAYTQPALFCLEIALFALARSWGLRPGWLLGHSAGELAAAHVAGVWPLADAARLVARRAALMQAIPVEGGLIAVALSETEARQWLAESGLELDLAAVNAPRSVVV
ncbi:MAG: type I polyketide synthase, partial [Propionibacteriaceae bacterium]|nr:type I polyketide synthase [Propionibacteriaceae bacterium]